MKNSLVFLIVFSEKKKGTRGQLCSRLTTVSLISSVLTVVLLITGPAHGNASTTGTSKEVDWTFQLPLIYKTEQENMMWNLWEFKKSQTKGETKRPTWAVPLIWKVSTVVVAVTHPWGQITQSCFLTALEGRSFHSQSEETGTIGGFWE